MKVITYIVPIPKQIVVDYQILEVLNFVLWVTCWKRLMTPGVWVK